MNTLEKITNWRSVPIGGYPGPPLPPGPARSTLGAMPPVPNVVPIVVGFFSGGIAALGILYKRRERRLAAAAAFRAAVFQGLAGLYPRATDWPTSSALDRRLRAVFPALQAAVATYRHYVADEDMDAFDQAWNLYRFGTTLGAGPDRYFHYVSSTSTTANAYGSDTVIHDDGSANFKRNVDRLMEFAKET